MAAEAVADTVAYLNEVRSTDGLSVFDHLAGVVRKVRHSPVPFRDLRRTLSPVAGIITLAGPYGR